MKRTTKYNLGYFEQGDYISAIYEMQRWETLDAQISSLFSVLGNGVIEGWDLLISSGLSIMVGPGSGHVNLVAVESVNSTEITNLLPNSTNYIYASLTQTSYWDKTVNFSALTSLDTTGELLYLGYAVTDTDSVTSVNTDNRTNLGFVNLIRQLIEEHHHIGGTDNPPPVNLSTEVQGIINQNNLPDLDASKIMTGTIDEARLPDINHITNLINQGTLTHAQLDSFVQALNITGNTLMGETSTVNLLQLLLALKHIYPDIDEYLVNEIAYIPGISPDNYVDWDNTTATVDILPSSSGGTHTITGASVTGKNVYTKTWDTESEFDAGTHSDVFIDGDSVELEAQETTLLFDNFTTSTGWQVVTEDLSSVPSTITLDNTQYVTTPPSGKITIGGQQVEVILSLTKTFDATDWSEYNYIKFYLKTTNVDHGDVYFYLKDVYSGTQDSYIKVLDRNAPTVNIDTLQNGWQEVIVDISSFERANINTIGLYVSTQDGWDTSKGFDLNIDKISLSTGNIYKEDGYLRLIYGGNFLYDFWRIRWDAAIPTDTNSTGLVFKVRSRVGNTLLDLNQAIWSSYTTTSGSEIPLPSGSLYKYIETEVYFGASTDLTRTAVLKKLYLDFYTADTENSFNYNTKDDWDSGSLYNIDTVTTPNSMLISKTEEVNDIFYGTSGNAVQLDDDLVELYRITGTTLPRSTYQMLNSIASGFGLLTGVSRGNNGNIWVADTDNDRVVEVDKSGALIRGFFGSYLVENSESTEATTTTTSTTSTSTLIANPQILQTIYNLDKGYLYLIFDRDLIDAEISAITGKTLRIGTQIVYLDQFVLGKFFGGFDNVLRIQVTGSEKTMLNHLLSTDAPSVVIASPYEAQAINNTTITAKFLLYNFEVEIGGNGIRVTLDGVTVQDIYTTEIQFTGLANGIHTVRAQLLNSDSTLNTNIEAIAEGTFVIYSGTLSVPRICVTSPRPNQIYSSSPVQIEFDVNNFPILATGQHLRYIVDSDAPVDYYSTEPILIEGLDSGEHSVRLYLVSSSGSDLGYTYGSVTIDFIVGLNSEALAKFYCSMGTSPVNIDTIICNMLFSDIYSPFDVQYIQPGNDVSNPNDKESILIGKLVNNYIASKIG